MALTVPRSFLTSATRHEEFFSTLIDRIPAHLVLPQAAEEEDGESGPLKGPERFYKHRKIAIPVDEKKRAAKEGKKARFDPAQQLTVSQLQAQQEGDRVSKRAKELAAKAAKLEAIAASQKDGDAQEGGENDEEEDDDDDEEEDSENESDFVDDVSDGDDEEAGENDEEDDDEDDEEDDDEEGDVEENEGSEGGDEDVDGDQAVAHENPDSSTSGSGSSAKNKKVERHSIDALRLKLAKKISDFRTSRNLKEPGTGTPRHDRNSKPKPAGGGGGKGAAAAAAAAGARGENKHSGNKRKGLVGVGAEAGVAVVVEPLSVKEQAALVVAANKEAKTQAMREAAALAVNDSGDVQFTMLNNNNNNNGGGASGGGAGGAMAAVLKGPLKAPGRGSKVQKIKSLLQRAEEKELRLKELKQQGEEGAAVAKQEKWKDTLKQATGELVLEDKTKLKKALQRRDAAKKKSQKKWGKILSDQKDQKDSKQATRESNLKSRSNNGYPIPGKDEAKVFGTDEKERGGGGAASSGGGGKGGDKKRKVADGSSSGGGGGGGSAGGKKKRGGMGSAGFEGKKGGFLNN